MDTILVAPSTGQEMEVLAKARRRRFTLEYKRRTQVAVLESVPQASNPPPLDPSENRPAG